MFSLNGSRKLAAFLGTFLSTFARNLPAGSSLARFASGTLKTKSVHFVSQGACREQGRARCALARENPARRCDAYNPTGNTLRVCNAITLKVLPRWERASRHVHCVLFARSQQEGWRAHSQACWGAEPASSDVDHGSSDYTTRLCCS